MAVEKLGTKKYLFKNCDHSCEFLNIISQFEIFITKTNIIHSFKPEFLQTNNQVIFWNDQVRFY